jgi:hypothetical protein
MRWMCIEKLKTNRLPELAVSDRDSRWPESHLPSATIRPCAFVKTLLSDLLVSDAIEVTWQRSFTSSTEQLTAGMSGVVMTTHIGNRLP